VEDCGCLTNEPPIPLADGWSRDGFLSAFAHVRLRTLEVKVNDKQMPPRSYLLADPEGGDPADTTQSDEKHHILFPTLDLINHSFKAHTRVEFRDNQANTAKEKNTCSKVSTRFISWANEKVFFN